FNNRACELLDIPEEVFRDRPNIHDIIAYQVSQGDFKDPESEIESALAGWAEAKKLGEPFVFERARPNGTIISYWNNPLDDGGMVRTFTDVTERVRAEEAVRRQSELLSITQENMDQGILLVDENDVVVLFNKRVCELLDISEDFMNAHPTMTEMVAHQEAQGEFVEFEESTKTQVFAWNDEKGAREPFVYERHRPDGTILSVWNNPLEGGGMVRTFTDVTERRRAQEAMREGEERLKFIFERSPVAIEVAGHDGEILFANDRAGELFGMPVDRLVGTSINNLYADVSQRGAILAELNESGSVRDAEIRFRRPDGTEVHALVNTEEMEFEGQTGIVGWHYDITERQIMEEQLERQKASLEATLDTMVQGLIAVDPKGRVGLFNRTACELLDLPEEFLASGPTTAEIYDYQLAMGEFETLDPEIKETVKTEAGSLGLDILEYERQRPNGRWLLVMTSPRPDGGYVRTFLDVTERHEIAAELERQRALLKTSLDNMEQGMLVMGADDRIVLYNDRVCEMLDVPASYFDTQPTNPEFWQHQAEMDEFSTLESERRAELDLWVDTEKRRYLGGYERMRPNGMHIWVTINPLPDGGLVETYVDVTERRRAEIDLERQLELQETLIATMPVPVYLLDADRRFTACNESFRALLGQSLDFYLGNTADDVLPERIAGAIGENDEELLTSGGSVRAELRINAEDGSLHDLVLQKAVFTNPDGSPGGIVGVMTDISQEMEARDQLEQAKRAAEEASQAKTSFVANMSHEIRTPLSGITGFLELLTLSNLDTDQRRMVESANLAANSLIELIGDILDFSKIEAGYLAINSTEVEPRLIVDEVLSVMMPRASERNTRLQTQVWPDVPERIIADPLRLRQILVNIVGNAVKFTETGSIHIELKVVPGQKGGDELCFEITDTGVGFDNSKHRDLFEQFSQVDESSTRKFGGTGLGLAICKRLVEMMNGQIGYDAKLGSGACFWFTLPLLKVQAVPNQPLSTSGAVAHVLSLDPSANRFVTDVESALQSQGFTVKTAPGSTEQITLAAENDALVAVSSGESSLDLPVLEGRSEPTNVILIVPSVDFTVRQRAIKAGFTHLLTFAQAVNAQPPIALATFASQTWLGIRRATSTKSEISTGSEIAQILDPAVAGKPILVIDDIEMNRMIASRQLQQLGLSHDLTTNGSEGLAAACKGDYALILADVSMPVMDGYEFTARWRDWESREGAGRTQVPVIAMTANATSSDAERCVAAGMDDYMSKPVTLDRMSAMILKWIGSGAVTSGEPKPATGSKALLDELSPIDLSVLASIIGSDDRDLLLQMADLFVSTFPGLQTRIEQAIDNQDRGELREAAHAAKGASRNAGATPLGDILYEIEEGAANLDLADLRDLADQAAKEFGRILKTLEAEQQGQ
ncbi:MAG: PAS domain S-box protein, partial [Rhodospirillaceae bacterium]|nr:PAS domain S-box protein [Rhodospirillaceae bacterium]